MSWVNGLPVVFLAVLLFVAFAPVIFDLNNKE